MKNVIDCLSNKNDMKLHISILLETQNNLLKIKKKFMHMLNDNGR